MIEDFRRQPEYGYSVNDFEFILEVQKYEKALIWKCRGEA